MRIVIFTILFLLANFGLNAQNDSAQKVSALYELSLEELMNIKVVTATGFAQTVSEAPSTMRVITSKQIEERGYEHLEDVLRDLEGVDIIHLSGYMPSVIYFRGLYGAENLRTLLLIDGIRENNLNGSPEFAGPAYSLHNVERIEIIWGPASALYGTDAFAGVINIVTKNTTGRNDFHYEKGFGTFNSSQDKFMLGLHKNDVAFSLSGSLFSTDGPRFLNRAPNYTGSYVDKAWSLNGSITHSYKKIKNTLCFRAFDTPMSWGNFLNSATKVRNLPSQGSNNSGSIGILQEDALNKKPNLYEPFSHTAFLRTEYSPSTRLILVSHLLYRETGLSDKSFVYLAIDTNIAPGLDTTSFYYVSAYNYSNRMRGIISANYSFTDNQKIFAGIDISQENLEPGNRGMILDTAKYVIDGIGFTNLHPRFKPRVFSIRNNFGSYLQYELKTSLLNTTRFSAGLRYDKNSDYTAPLSPRIAIITNPTDDFTLKLLFGTAFRSPTVTEINTAIRTFGDKAVNPEKVTTYEMNIMYNFSRKFLLQWNIFQNSISDIFVLNTLTVGTFSQKPAQGKAEVKGAEFRADIILSTNFSAFGNFTFQQGIQTETTTGVKFDIPNIPELKGNAGITQTVGNVFSVTAIANWVGERKLPHSNPYGADKNYKMPGYLLGNIILTTKKLFNDRISASVNVKNIFNSNYLDPGIRTADGILYSTTLEQPGRTMLLKLLVDLH